MPKYIIYEDHGYGDNNEEIEADNLEEAEIAAYDMWKEGAESQADYGVRGNKEATDEMREDYL